MQADLLTTTPEDNNFPIEYSRCNDIQKSAEEQTCNWSQEQEDYLKTVVTNIGTNNWSEVVKAINVKFPSSLKTKQACRERWHNRLDPSINRSPWAHEEEAALILAHMKYQNRWVEIASLLNRRDNCMIKNKFYSIFRRVKNKVKHRDYTCHSKLELYEIYYMVSVMEDYMRNPYPLPDITKKRNKDFMFNLVKDIEEKSVAQYKADLVAKFPLNGTLASLLKELIGEGSGEVELSKPNKECMTDTRSITFPVAEMSTATKFSEEEKVMLKKLFFPDVNAPLQKLEGVIKFKMDRINKLREILVKTKKDMCSNINSSFKMYLP
jgi:hypothetical protein